MRARYRAFAEKSSPPQPTCMVAIYLIYQATPNLLGKCKAVKQNVIFRHRPYGKTEAIKWQFAPPRAPCAYSLYIRGLAITIDEAVRESAEFSIRLRRGFNVRRGLLSGIGPRRSDA
jgi:hypothetical protein